METTCCPRFVSLQLGRSQIDRPAVLGEFHQWLLVLVGCPAICREQARDSPTCLSQTPDDFSLRQRGIITLIWDILTLRHRRVLWGMESETRVGLGDKILFLVLDVKCGFDEK